MKKFIIGFILGTILTTSSIAMANNPIKLVVNGKEIQSDVPPQVINGRTMVPARFLAESLGAKVEWDAQNNSVVVTSGSSEIPTDLQPITTPQTLPTQQSLNTELSNQGGTGQRLIQTSKTSVDNKVSAKILHDKYGAKITTYNNQSNNMTIKINKATITMSTTQYNVLINNKEVTTDVIIEEKSMGQIKIYLINNQIYLDDIILEISK